MACSGSHCTSHGTGTTTCSNHRGSCPSNRVLNSFGISTSDTIVASELEHMRGQIRDELGRWNLHANYNYTIRSPGTISSGSVIEDPVVEDLMQMVSDVHGSSGHSDRDGLLIEDTDWGIAAESVRVKYNIIRQNCICNSDCSCNAVCACHNDCGCHYSDPRLKVDVYKMM